MTRRSELQRIELLARLFATADPRIELGIGDDAAILADPTSRLVWTIDAQVEDVHFRRGWLSFFDLGFRATMAAASDLAAMGAEPLATLSSLTLDPSVSEDDLEALALGQREAAARVGAPVVGGNLAAGSALTVTTTLLGKVSSILTRGGAAPGDLLLAAGPLGLAAAGLRALMADRGDEALAPAVAAWRRPAARVGEGRLLAGRATAAIDVSDGLSLDLSRLASASFVRAVLSEEALLSHSGEPLATAARALGLEALSLLLAGGEDYALLATSPAPVEGFSVVGRIERGGGVWLEARNGLRALEPEGFDHFAP